MRQVRGSYTSFDARLNYRDHRKLIIIDGLIGYIGGMNISDRYEWFQLGLRADTITGLPSRQLQSVFLSNWQRQSGEVCEDEYFLAASAATTLCSGGQ